jgi:DNA-binding transcriptional ArsR family regulator
MPKTSLNKTSVEADKCVTCEVSQLSPTALALVADFFKVLSEASRLQIVCCLKTGPKNVSEIVEETDLGQANVSKHLKILAQAGIVARQPQGANVYYQVSNPFIFELCELVCNSLTLQLKERNQQLDQLRSISKSS